MVSRRNVLIVLLILLSVVVLVIFQANKANDSLEKNQMQTKLVNLVLARDSLVENRLVFIELVKSSNEAELVVFVDAVVSTNTSGLEAVNAIKESYPKLAQEHLYFLEENIN